MHLDAVAEIHDDYEHEYTRKVEISGKKTHNIKFRGIECTINVARCK